MDNGKDDIIFKFVQNPGQVKKYVPILKLYSNHNEILVCYKWQT